MVGSAVIRGKPKDFRVLTKSRNELDLTNYKEVLDFFDREKFDAMIICAAKVGGILANSTMQRQFLVQNLHLQNALITSAADAGIRNVIFLGSACIYPKQSPQPISERHLMTGPLESTNEGYAIAKIAGLRLMRAIYEESGFSYVSLMPTNLYGPNDNFHPTDSHVAASLMRKFHEAKVSNARKVTIWGTGRPTREFLHVDDMASACWFALSHGVGGEIYNVGTGIEIPIVEYANILSQVTGFNGQFEFDLSKPDGVMKRVLDVSKINKLGWSAKIDIYDGIRDTYEWFKENFKLGKVRGI